MNVPEGRCKLHPRRAVSYLRKKRQRFPRLAWIKTSIVYNLGMALWLLPVDAGPPERGVISPKGLTSFFRYSPQAGKLSRRQSGRMTPRLIARPGSTWAWGSRKAES